MPTRAHISSALLALLIACLCLPACTAAPLARPAILGASASAGFGCETTGPDGKPYLVDMESVYQAAVPGLRPRPLFLADAGFYTRPRQAQTEQIDAALAANPSLLIAIDYLFWSVYAYRDKAMTPEAIEQDRHDALQEALAQLNRFHGPIIVGDIPNMHASVGHMLSANNVPPPNQLEDFNRAITTWAADRPANAPAIIIPIANLGRAVESHTGLSTTYQTFTPEQAAELLQPDHLHPTPAGLAVLLREGLAGLAALGTIKSNNFRTDLADITTRLPAEARKADARREPGLWTLLALQSKLKDLDTALDNKQCAQASDLFDQIMEKASRLKQPPDPMADLYVYFLLSNYKDACPDAQQSIRRWRDRMTPGIERPLPDPWPLNLWSRFNNSLDDRNQNVQRALRLKRENPSLSKDYDDIIRSAAQDARRSDPLAYLELLPDWQAELERQSKSAKKIINSVNHVKQGSEPSDSVDTDIFYDFRSVADQIKKESTTNQNGSQTVKLSFEFDYLKILDPMTDLEYALTATGRPDDAALVRTRLEQIAAKDEIEAARTRTKEKAAAAQAAPQAKP
jgi:lysophospholipase L1-like esterase